MLNLKTAIEQIGIATYGGLSFEATGEYRDKLIAILEGYVDYTEAEAYAQGWNEGQQALKGMEKKAILDALMEWKTDNTFRCPNNCDCIEPKSLTLYLQELLGDKR